MCALVAEDWGHGVGSGRAPCWCLGEGWLIELGQVEAHICNWEDRWLNKILVLCDGQFEFLRLRQDWECHFLCTQEKGVEQDAHQPPAGMLGGV